MPAESVRDATKLACDEGVGGTAAAVEDGVEEGVAVWEGEGAGDGCVLGCFGCLTFFGLGATGGGMAAAACCCTGAATGAATGAGAGTCAGGAASSSLLSELELELSSFGGGMLLYAFCGGGCVAVAAGAEVGAAVRGFFALVAGVVAVDLFAGATAGRVAAGEAALEAP